MVIDATPTAGTPTLPQSVFGRVMPVTRTLDAHFNIIHEHQTLDIRYMHEALGDAFQRDVRQQLPGKHSHKLYVIPDTRVVGKSILSFNIQHYYQRSYLIYYLR
jgi:hypothetical protein